MKYRKKPVVIEAFRVGIDSWPDWAWEFVTQNIIILHHLENDDGYVEIKTREGWLKANKGEWIIQGVKGEPYPCGEEIFELTYEPVETKQ